MVSVAIGRVVAVLSLVLLSRGLAEEEEGDVVLVGDEVVVKGKPVCVVGGLTKRACLTI